MTSGHTAQQTLLRDVKNRPVFVSQRGAVYVLGTKGQKMYNVKIPNGRSLPLNKHVNSIVSGNFDDTVEFVAEGGFGKVVKGQANKAGKHMFVIKTTVDEADDFMVEFHVANTIYKLIPRTAIRHYSIFNNGKAMLMEYIPTVKYSNLLTPTKWVCVLLCVREVAIALDVVRQTLPHFRHNDLHYGNVLVSSVFPHRPFIIDFSLAYIGGRTKLNQNPLITEGQYTKYGIFPGNHPYFDIHMYIYSLYEYFTKITKDKKRPRESRLYAQVLQYRFRNLVPLEYLKKDGRVTQKGSFRPDVVHDEFPSTTKLVQLIDTMTSSKG